MRKNFLIAALLIVGFFFTAATAQAEMQTYEGHGEYQVQKGETIDFGKQRAKKFAERDALEQIYLYVRSQSSAENFLLTKDEIIVIAAGLMYVTKTKFSTTTEDGKFIVQSTVVAEIDSDEVPAAVERYKKSRLEN